MRYWETSDVQDGRQRFVKYGGESRWPPAVKFLVISNVVVFAIEILLRSFSPDGIKPFLDAFGLSNKFLFREGFIWQLLSYAFLHDPDRWMHILFNMLFLYWFGRAIEQSWGTKRFLVFYLTAAAFSGLLFCGFELFVHPQGSSVCIGASGAIMAIVMVYALYWPNQLILFMFIFPLRMRTFVLITIGIEFISLLDLRRNYGVANMAHLGGLLFGYLVVKAGPLRDLAISGLHSFESRKTGVNERRLDQILDKVQRKGLNSLSWVERWFLKKMSRKR